MSFKERMEEWMRVHVVDPAPDDKPTREQAFMEGARAALLLAAEDFTALREKFKAMTPEKRGLSIGPLYDAGQIDASESLTDGLRTRAGEIGGTDAP